MEMDEHGKRSGAGKAGLRLVVVDSRSLPCCWRRGWWIELKSKTDSVELDEEAWRSSTHDDAGGAAGPSLSGAAASGRERVREWVSSRFDQTFPGPSLSLQPPSELFLRKRRTRARKLKWVGTAGLTTASIHNKAAVVRQPSADIYFFLRERINCFWLLGPAESQSTAGERASETGSARFACVAPAAALRSISGSHGGAEQPTLATLASPLAPFSHDREAWQETG
jgi:hypothetical protein